jgi:2-polyprenyl-3-methyl-5-hydroxy-6-metoxy-1,4-benzoquinol methylase
MKFETSIKKRLSGRHKACLSMLDCKNKKILDIGCGFGWFEQSKAKEAKEIIGIDLNKKDLEIANKECNLKNVRFKKGSVLNLKNLKENYFDFVVMFDVIEHIPLKTEQKALIQIKRVLKKKGILIISTPINNFSKFIDPAWYFGHRHYSEKELKKILNKEGFNIKKIEKRGGFWEIFSMILFYPCKWIFNSEIPFKDYFDKKRDEEYLNKKGFSTIFIVAENG